VQQEKMARFLALFLTAAYECARGLHMPGTWERMQGADARRVRARSGAPRRHVFHEAIGKKSPAQLGPATHRADFGSSRRKCSNPDYTGMRRMRPDVHALPAAVPAKISQPVRKRSLLRLKMWQH